MNERKNERMKERKREREMDGMMGGCGGFEWRHLKRGKALFQL